LLFIFINYIFYFVGKNIKIIIKKQIKKKENKYNKVLFLKKKR